MTLRLRELAVITALTIGSAGFSVMPASALPIAQDQDHHDRDQRQDYSNNTYYQLGNREGLQDHQRNVQRKKHKHHYRNSDDKTAHDQGYQQGWQGQDYHSQHHDQDPH
jgi:hypothetical protein